MEWKSTFLLEYKVTAFEVLRLNPRESKTIVKRRNFVMNWSCWSTSPGDQLVPIYVTSKSDACQDNIMIHGFNLKCNYTLPAT